MSFKEVIMKIEAYSPLISHSIIFLAICSIGVFCGISILLGHI